MKTLIELKTALDALFGAGQVRKIVLSKPQDEGTLRAQGHLFEKGKAVFLQIETFRKDGKALHENIPAASAAQALVDLFTDPEKGFSQCNILSPVGDVEVKRTKTGAWLITGKFKTDSAQKTTVSAHDHKKTYILQEGVPYPFLVRLGVVTEEGKLRDKKRPKFLQINRFLENVEVIYPSLPKEGTIRVLDLCCGKSYLTFAVYHYLTAIRGRQVEMLGVDLKEDVIAFCSDVAHDVGFASLRFLCTDIGKLEIKTPPHLVLSLHACDIATDIVLAKAIATKADVILSTPCCQHELMGQMTRGESELKSLLSPITKHSMLRQKLCDALTDGLRCHMLEMNGYDVTVCELIDPEQTPKNLLIRAVRGSISREKQEMLKREYDTLLSLATIDPYLPHALKDYAKT